MLHLQAGGWQASLLPAQGAAFAMLEHDGRAILQPLAGRDPNATPAGAFWMLPWTNRLDGGLFPWAGERYMFPITHPSEGNTLHGLARAMPWTVHDSGPAHAVLRQRLRQPPFDYAAQLGVSLAEEGLTLSLHLEHVGEAPCPMGFGWHPWFARPAGTAVRFSASHTLLRDNRKLPVAEEPSLGIDGPDTQWLGIDDHFPGWNGIAVLRRPDLTLTMEAVGDWAHNIQFFAPMAQPVLCLEPVSHVPDAINRPALAAFGPMRVLAPGESLVGRINLRVG
jgi:aldose 1-epimerase